MRGGDARTEALFSYVSCEARVPVDHPLRAIREIVNEALAALSPEFEKLYAKSGRPSIPPEKLLRALLLQAFYSVRSERQLMEQLDYNLLFRWFVGLSLDAVVWDVTGFTKNRERLTDGESDTQILAAEQTSPRIRCAAAFRAVRWATTDLTTAPGLSANSGSTTLRRTWLRTPPTGDRPSMLGQPVIPATPSVGGYANALRRCLAGARRL